MTKQSNGDEGERNREAGGLPRRRAPRTRPEGRLVLVDPKANSRLIAFLAGNLLHRIERDRCELCFGDLDLTRIAEAIGLIAIEPGMRDASFRDQYRSFETVIGIEGQRAVSATSIAASTGIPRETVRRKLKRLLALGYIVPKGRVSYVVAPGILQEPSRLAVFEHSFHQMTSFMNAMLEQGFLQWIPSGHAGRAGAKGMPP